MTRIPLDRTDLHLAPVTLDLDARLERWSSRSAHELRGDIAVASNQSDRSPRDRREALLQALRHDVEVHGWQLTLELRGLRLTHGLHSLVLGLPQNVRDYLEPDVVPQPRP